MRGSRLSMWQPLASTLSNRIQATESPVIVKMKELLKGKQGVISLAQGVVFWDPPDVCVAACASALTRANSYSPAEGIPALRAALQRKIGAENGLTRSEIMVTAGANQAYTNLVLALLDSGEKAALFRPYYFNHLMALQMTGCVPILVSSTSNLLPDVNELEKVAFVDPPDGRPARAVTIVNPGNPTGTMIPFETIKAISDVCEKYRAWLIVDNTYENFAWEEATPHLCLEAEHIINIFSFSKAYGMMGWRVGYLSFPKHLAAELNKVQDTIIIGAATASQFAALAALEDAGSDWVRERVIELQEPKRLIKIALADALGDDAVRGGTGAIYFLVSLPDSMQDDVAIATRLIDDFGVATIPGSACGAPGTIRVCYANLPVRDCERAAGRLSNGLRALRAENSGIPSRRSE